MQQAYNVTGIVSGPQLVASAEKLDLRRMRQSRRQVEASTKEARRAGKVARAKKVDASTYSAGAC